MSTSKKVTRFIGIDTNVAFKLQLDADIYTAQICQILGIGNTALPSVKKITASVSQAGSMSLLQKARERRENRII